MINEWCRAHKIQLTGHVDNLSSIHKVKDGLAIYFVANSSDQEVDIHARAPQTATGPFRFPGGHGGKPLNPKPATRDAAPCTPTCVSGVPPQGGIYNSKGTETY